MKSLGYVGAFLGGAIAGAVIGLLVAPEKGKDTRSKISDTVLSEWSNMTQASL